MSNKQNTQPTPLSEIGGDKNLPREQRANSRQAKAVKPPLPTLAYTGKTASERAADRNKANGLKLPSFKSTGTGLFVWPVSVSHSSAPY